MKDQIKLLIELQKHDARIQELEGMKKVWPLKLEALHGDVQKVQDLLARERQQLEETESWRRRQEEEARSQEAELLKAKQRSSMVKNAKEMMANERELQANRKASQEREEEVVKLGGAVETAKKSIAQHEADLEALRQHVAAEEEVAKTKIAEIDKQISDGQSARARGGGGQSAGAQEVFEHQDAARDGAGAGAERHLPGLQHEHPPAALQRPPARQLHRAMRKLQPHHLLAEADRRRWPTGLVVISFVF